MKNQRVDRVPVGYNTVIPIGRRASLTGVVMRARPLFTGNLFRWAIVLATLSGGWLTLTGFCQEAAKQEDPPSKKSHWAFQPVKRPQVPQVKGRADTDIDRFILAALEAKGQSVNREADRTTLIRRVSFDLTGLPPALGEIDAFVADAAHFLWHR